MKGMSSTFLGRVERSQEAMGGAMRSSGLRDSNPVPTPRRTVTQAWHQPRRTEVVVFARSLEEAFGPSTKCAAHA